MKRIVATIALYALSTAATAHEDRILPIAPDGTLQDLPTTFGPVRVLIDRSASDPRSITKVEISSRKFNVKLAQCVVAKLNSVAHVEATGSWYHDIDRLPPYVSLTFFSGRYDPSSYRNEFYSVTFSLKDGKIMYGQRASDPWWRHWRAIPVKPADKCSGWRSVGM